MITFQLRNHAFLFKQFPTTTSKIELHSNGALQSRIANSCSANYCLCRFVFSISKWFCNFGRHCPPLDACVYPDTREGSKALRNLLFQDQKAVRSSRPDVLFVAVWMERDELSCIDLKSEKEEEGSLCATFFVMQWCILAAGQHCSAFLRPTN